MTPIAFLLFVASCPAHPVPSWQCPRVLVAIYGDRVECARHAVEHMIMTGVFAVCSGRIMG